MPCSLLAQEDPKTSINQVDSLLHQTLSYRAYYIPNTITDNVLLEQVRFANLDPLIGEITQGLALMPLTKPYSMSAYKVSLPLATSYPQVNALTKRLGVNAQPSPESSIYGKQYDRLRVGLDSIGIGNNTPPFGISTWQNPLDLQLRLMKHTLLSLQQQSIGLFSYGGDVLAERDQLNLSSLSPTPQVLEQKVKQQNMRELADGLRLQEIERRYWVPGFESSIQFSQNYVSNNWYKGGSSNLNLFMRLYGSLTYTKDKIQWKSEIEDKLNLYNTDRSEADPIRRFRVADDLIRLRSNFGLKASKRWYYTLDAEGRTQLLNNYKGNTTDLQASPFAPLSVNIGLGMKYDYSTKSKSVYKRKFSYSMNLAPLSYTYRASVRDDIDLARHGLSKEKLSLHRIGSTLRANLQWDVNMNVTWQSRLYFNTSYSDVEAEWENTLTMRISRYFSTRINLQLRFDDSIKPDSAWNKYFQINELLSLGFNYRL